jgi:hypothetical protein
VPTATETLISTSSALSLLEDYDDATQVLANHDDDVQTPLPKIDYHIDKYHESSGDEDSEDVLSDDCEINKFWIKNLLEKRKKRKEIDLQEQRESRDKELKHKQQERLQKARLLSGYYSLQLQVMENSESIPRSKHSICHLNSEELTEEKQEKEQIIFDERNSNKKRRRSYSHRRERRQRADNATASSQQKHNEVYQQIQKTLSVALMIGEYLILFSDDLLIISKMIFD